MKDDLKSSYNESHFKIQVVVSYVQKVPTRSLIMKCKENSTNV